MGMSRQSRWTDLDDGTAVDLPTTARVMAAVRAVCTPSTLVLAGVVGFSWLALIGWTGAGSDSWQARTCAGLDQPPASCGSVRPRKDQSRLVPHDSVAGPSS